MRVLEQLEEDMLLTGNCFYYTVDNPEYFGVHRIPPFNCTITHLEID